MGYSRKKFFLFFAICFILFQQTLSFDCNSKDNVLQVHLVPHTHDDVGWLKTVDEYFYGANKTIQDAAVQYILDTVITELQKNPNRTFIYVEIAFFKRWWDQQTDYIKDVVKGLVAKKQLEFINGGWCMNDEAATHYNAIIDQMTLGHLFINDTFGYEARPTIGWHIDPFGHSAEQASLFSLMSFDGFFFGRIDQEDKDKRLKEQRMEMVWRGSRNYGKDSQIFTGVTYNGYGPPGGFCFDDFCSDPPIQDDPRLYDYNVKERVDLFVKETCEQANSYKTNHIMLTMGSDFQFQNALKWFKNLDKLIRHVNEDGRVNVFYSTPSRYLKAVHDSKKVWEVKTDDFFPYAHCPHCYWTGYFTSRPALKAYIRESNGMLQACKQMETLEFFDPRTHSPSSEGLRRAMGVNQHHDAVTGTEKQHVAFDYAKRLAIAREECKDLMTSFVKSKMSAQQANLDFQYCDFLNISVCQLTETEKSLAVNVYNPIARPIASFVRVPVNSRSYTVTDSDGTVVEAQVVSVSAETQKLRPPHQGHAAYELTFKVNTPSLGFSTYFITKTSTKKAKRKTVKVHSRKARDTDSFIENEYLRLDFSTETGRLTKMVEKVLEITLEVDQQFFWYNGSQGNADSRQTSGAYIFRPNRSEPYPMTDGNKASIEIVKGPLVEEVRQTFGSIVSQVIRLYSNKPYAEFEYTVGPIPVDDNMGKEIITSFTTNIQSDGKFYTDANGREMKERIRNHRDTWDLKVTEPVSGNYYPVNSRMFINDTKMQLVVLNDRSQGGSSIRDGQMEIMLHRRLLKDDFLGVGEPLNEPGLNGKGLITRGKHHVVLATPDKANKLHRLEGEFLMLQPLLSFAVNPHSKKYWREYMTTKYSALSRPLPPFVHLLTMETIRQNTVLMRFENFLEEYEGGNAVDINLDGLFKDFTVTKVTEMNLSANQELKDKKMWNWDTNETQFHFHDDYVKFQSKWKITLKPMQIRTYIVEIKKN